MSFLFSTDCFSIVIFFKCKFIKLNNSFYAIIFLAYIFPFASASSSSFLLRTTKNEMTLNNSAGLFVSCE